MGVETICKLTLPLLARLEPKTSWYFLQTLNNMLWPLRNRILWLTQYLSIFWTRDVD